MVIHGRCFIQSQCKKFIDNTTNEKNGTSDGYSFSQANYSAGKCGSGYTLTGDFPQGNVKYDASTNNLRAPWKMPNKAQFEELINNTTTQWTSMNGVNGRKFTSKSNSSKYIFLPAGGFWSSSHNNAGSRGNYWSTTFHNSSSSWYLGFDSSAVITSYTNQYYGMTVRGIQ